MVKTSNKALPRFDGAEAWATLTPDQQAEIGAIALEFVLNWHGEEIFFSGILAEPESRPFIAAQPLLTDMLVDSAQAALKDLVPAIDDDDLSMPIPSLLGPVCRVCLCSEYDPCDEGCGWAEPDLCTSCVGAEPEHKLLRQPASLPRSDEGGAT